MYPRSSRNLPALRFAYSRYFTLLLASCPYLYFIGRERSAHVHADGELSSAGIKAVRFFDNVLVIVSVLSDPPIDEITVQNERQLSLLPIDGRTIPSPLSDFYFRVSSILDHPNSVAQQNSEGRFTFEVWEVSPIWLFILYVPPRSNLLFEGNILRYLSACCR